VKKSKFTEIQIVSILKQADAGVPVKDICRHSMFRLRAPRRQRADPGRSMKSRPVSSLRTPHLSHDPRA
jgi:hypothetical protein